MWQTGPFSILASFFCPLLHLVQTPLLLLASFTHAVFKKVNRCCGTEAARDWPAAVLQGNLAVDWRDDCCANRTCLFDYLFILFIFSLLISELWPYLFVFLQVVELISSAIGDVVQGLYYENSSNSEVKKRFVSLFFLTLMTVFTLKMICQINKQNKKTLILDVLMIERQNPKKKSF